MKNIYKLILILFAGIVALPACQEKFEEEYNELELDYEKIDVKHEGGKYTFMVYFSGDWTISLDEGTDWVTLGQTSGTGVTMVDIEFEPNNLFKRSFNMVISGGGESKTIPVTQMTSLTKVVLKFMNEDSIDLANCSGRVVAKLVSNLPPSFVESHTPVTSGQWITGCEIKNGQGESEYVYDVEFNVSANETGESRNSKISLQFNDADQNVYLAEVEVVQSSKPGELLIDDNVVYGSAAKDCFEEVKGGLMNFADFADQISYSVSGDEFLENVRIDAGILYYTMPENTSSEKREAEITLVYGDNIASATHKVVQREVGVSAIYEISTLKELLAWNKATWSDGDLVVLTDDIDCSGFDASAEWETKIFSGTFEGNGHVIDNFVMEKSGATAFFQRVVGAGSVSDLTFGQGCSFTAIGAESSLNKNTYAASLAAFASGTASFSNVVNKGSVKVASDATGGTGANFIGGICGFFNSSGSIDGCRNEGTVTNEAAVANWTCLGGAVGCVSLKGEDFIMTQTTNTGDVRNMTDLTYNMAIGGLVGRVNQNASLSMTDCSSSGNLLNNASSSSGVYMAGLLGHVDDPNKVKLLLVKFTDCVVSGNIDNKCTKNPSKTAIGGFVGFCYSNEIKGCDSKVSISNTFNNNVLIGGFVGQIEGTDVISTVIDDCSADVVITPTLTQYAGVLVGRVTYSPAANKTVSVTNVKVSGKYADNVLDASNYKSYCYGTATAGKSHYKPLDGVTFN